MHFDRYDIIKMGIAAGITAVVFLIATNRPSPAAPAPSMNRISWNEAMTLRNTYTNRNPIRVDTGGISSVVLEGFRMDAAAINEIMNNNKNGINGNTRADQLVVYLGNEVVAGRVQWRLVAAGVQNGTLLKNPNPTIRDQSSVFDRADPCPPNPK